MPRGTHLLAVIGVIALITAGFHLAGVTNSTIVALTFLTVVLLTAASQPLWAAVTASLVSMLSFNFFFLEPVGTFNIADPQNWVALGAFLAVSLVASNLSSAVRAREREAVERRDELARLFDLGRDILIMTSGPQAMSMLSQVIARRFDLQYVAICQPTDEAWNVAASGQLEAPLPTAHLADAFARASQRMEFDASTRVYAGHQSRTIGGAQVQLVPLRSAAAVIGLLAASGRRVEAGTLDALGGLVAIAIERTRLLEERRAAELVRQGEELKSALLASLGHDLRTPLTAIRVAASNLQRPMSEADQREQSTLVISEVERLTRLFQNILEMARIDAGAIAAEQRWVHAAEIIEVARELVAPTLAQHRVAVTTQTALLVKLDPRLTASALSHLLENAGQYSPAGSTIEVIARTEGGELRLTVGDRGPGLADGERERLFDRFYRGEAKGGHAGSGMGLSIVRGLLAVEGGRAWAENRPDGGAAFTIAVPVETKTLEPETLEAETETESNDGNDRLEAPPATTPESGR